MFDIIVVLILGVVLIGFALTLLIVGIKDNKDIEKF